MKTKLEWVDSHCHLDFSEFDEDREQVIASCRSSAINSILIPGVVSTQWPLLQRLAEKFESLYFAVGVHPWWIASEFNLQLDNYSAKETLALEEIPKAIEDFVHHSKCVAIGECGLDGAIETPLTIQQEWLDRQLDVAQRLNRPVILHARRAHNELVTQLKNFSLAAGGVIHAFSGSAQMGEDFIKLGFKLGIGGTITFERAQKTRDAVKSLPLESLLLETDSPDMPLFGFQGQRNSPEKILLVAQELAKLRGESIKVIAAQTTENAKKLFGI